MKLQNLSTRAFLRLIVGGASLTSISFVVHPLCLHKRYKDDTWWFQRDDPSVSMGGAVFYIISRRNYRYLQMDYAEH